MPPKRKSVGRPKGSKNKKKHFSTDDENNIVEQHKMSEETCDCCKTTFRTKHELAKHKKKCQVNMFMNKTLQTKKALFSCGECNKKFTFEESLNKHVILDHSTTPESVECNYCPVRCPDKTTLEEHISKFHEREIFKCIYCDKKFVRRAHVLRHLSQKGCGGQQIVSYPCEICKATFSRKDNLIVHLRLQHINQGYRCKHCTYRTRNFSKLIIHAQKEHNGSSPQYECDICSKVTSSRGAMIKHLEIHGDKKYACDVCGYSTFTIEVMRRHVFTHVPEKPYKCSICNRSYIQRMQLERHLEKHAGHVCWKCNMNFKDKASLIAHRREHNGNEQLLCPYDNCKYSSKELSDENSFNNHVKSHENKPFKCEVCSKSFVTELNIRRHLATHSLDRPRRCMYCVRARAFVRGEQLVKHVRKSHPDVFRSHLTHVRQVLGADPNIERVSKSELDSVLNVLDAEADRIMQGYGGEGVLYGGMQDSTTDASTTASASATTAQEQPKSDNPLMTEDELVENLSALLAQLVDENTLTYFGWPKESVDVVLEKVIEQCGAKTADKERWTRVQRLRENAKHLFLHVIDDKNIGRMLSTHTIDQVIKHILTKVTEPEADNEPVDEQNGDDDVKKCTANLNSNV